MKKRSFSLKRILIIVTTIIVVIFFGVFFFTTWFFRPMSDQDIVDKFEGSNHKPNIYYKNFKDSRARVVAMQTTIDSTLPILVFVHGSPGTSMDFRKYLIDKELNQKSNMISYDRIGYGNTQEPVLRSVEEENQVLDQIIKDFDLNKVILIGYSYGGTIVMAAADNYQYKLALAPAIKGELEPMFWALNLTQWQITKSLIPNVFINAATEKFRHLTELPNYEAQWTKSRSSVSAIHGDSDRIVPYENSLYLDELFEANRFELITIKNGNHALVWTDFELIKNEILKVL